MEEINKNPVAEKNRERELLLESAKCVKEKNIGAAALLLRRLYSLNPKNSEIYHLGGLLLHYFGEFSSARYWIKRAINLSGDNARYYHNMGIAALEEGRFEEARSHFKKALETDKSYVLAEEALKNENLWTKN